MLCGCDSYTRPTGLWLIYNIMIGYMYKLCYKHIIKMPKINRCFVYDVNSMIISPNEVPWYYGFSIAAVAARRPWQMSTLLPRKYSTISSNFLWGQIPLPPPPPPRGRKMRETETVRTVNRQKYRHCMKGGSRG